MKNCHEYLLQHSLKSGGTKEHYRWIPGSVPLVVKVLIYNHLWCWSTLQQLFSFSEQIAASLGMEIRRMHRRKQLQYSGIQSPPNMSPPHESSSNTSVEASTSSSSGNMFSALSPNKKDTPLFTFKQVSMICERMMKDREEQIKNEYNSVLTCKLAGN